MDKTKYQFDERTSLASAINQPEVWRPEWEDQVQRAGAERLLDAHEVAAVLHVPVSWVRDHTRSGDLPHVTLGRYKRYQRESVLAWLRAQEEGVARCARHQPMLTGRMT